MRVRSATQDDIPALAHGHRVAWQMAFQGILPDDTLDKLTDAEFEIAWQGSLCRVGRTNLVSELDGTLTGFMAFGPSQDKEAPSHTAQVYGCYLFPPFWGSGHASLLWQEGTTLLAKHFEEVTLWVFEANHRARRFYEKMGLTPDGAISNQPIFEVSAPQLRYRGQLTR